MKLRALIILSIFAATLGGCEYVEELPCYIGRCE